MYFLIFLLVAFVIYWPGLKGEFIFDDFTSVVDNKEIRDLAGAFLNIFHRFRGLSDFTFALNYHFFQLQPFFYRFFNVCIHVINSFLVFLLLKLTLRLAGFKDKNESWVFAFLGALFFLIHPVQTQAVSYISQRPEILATLFYLLTLYFYGRGRSGKRKLFYLFLAVFSGLLATTCKETVLTLPLAIVLYEWFFISKNFKKVLKKLFYFLPVLLAVFIRFFYTGFLKPLGRVSTGSFFKGKVDPRTLLVVLKHATTALEKTEGITRLNYLLTQINVVVRYISLIFVPLGQRLDYDFSISQSFFSWPVWFNFLIILSILGLAVFLFIKKGWRLACFGILFFFIGLIPSSSIFPIADLIFEHRMYLSMMGISFVLAGVLSKISLSKWGKKRMGDVYFLIVVWFLVLAILTFKRNLLWADKFEFWQDNYKKAPKKARVAKNFGVQLALAGETGKGLKLIGYAVGQEPENIKYRIALATILDADNRFVEAEKEYNKILEKNDKLEDIYFSLGNLYLRQGKNPEAIENFEKVVDLKKDYALAYVGLCSSYKNLEEVGRAIEYCERALEIKPNLEAARQNLSELLD